MKDELIRLQAAIRILNAAEIAAPMASPSHAGQERIERARRHLAEMAQAVIDAWEESEAGEQGPGALQAPAGECDSFVRCGVYWVNMAQVLYAYRFGDGIRLNFGGEESLTLRESERDDAQDWLDLHSLTMVRTLPSFPSSEGSSD